LAYVEAYIDFSETDNIEDLVLENVKLNLEKLSKEIEVCTRIEISQQCNLMLHF